jgi:sugar phosphate isomerase/epimerase
VEATPLQPAAPASLAGCTLWAGTVGFTSPLDERFAAAAAVGCQQVSLSPPDVLRAASDGTTAAEIGRRARDLGLDLIIDPVMNWYPDREPSPSRFAGVSSDDALRMCEALGVVSLSAIATATSDLPVPELAGPFGALCDRAAGFGAQVHLEFIPFTVVRTLRIGWDLVRAAGRLNGGLVFDTWHFFRGDPDFGVLAGIPGDRIFCVQLDDASAGSPPSPPPGTPPAASARRAEYMSALREETSRRLLPGDGALDLPAAIRALHRIGALTWVGPEVISPELAAMPVLDAATLAMDRTRAALAAALSTPAS